MLWTNDRWLSNMHRVVNPSAADAPHLPRLSVAFFNHPNYDTLIECLASQGLTGAIAADPRRDRSTV